MAASDQFVDRLEDRGYVGAIALAYDAYLPPGIDIADDPFYRRLIAKSGGTGLELGIGNGRFLIPARQVGLEVTLHHGDIHPPLTHRGPAETAKRHEPRSATGRGSDVVETGVDPVTLRFSGVCSAD